jgi:hypothetical protein
MPEQKIGLHPADLIFEHSDGFISTAIRWFTRRRGESRTYANHVAGMVNYDDVVEALTRVRLTPFKEWRKTANDYEIWRCEGLEPHIKDAICEHVQRDVNEVYGVSKILSQALDGFLSKLWFKEVTLFRNISKARGRGAMNICSTLWAWAYYDEAGIQFNCHPATANPDGMHDFVKSNPEWACVYSR